MQGVLTTFGAVLVGGGITFFVEWRMHLRRQLDDLKSKVGELMLDLVMVQADWAILAETIAEAKDELRDHPEGAELWQTLPRFEWRPALTNLDVNARISPVLPLGSRALIEDAGFILSNYSAMIHHVETYNSLIERYEIHMSPHTYIKDDRRYFKTLDNDPTETVLRGKINQRINHIADTLPKQIPKVAECQKELFEASKRHFGYADFLRLPKRQGSSTQQS